MSGNMLPLASVAYTGRLIVANAVISGDDMKKFAIGTSLPHGGDVHFRELRSRVMRTPAASAMTKFVRHVFGCGCPSEIVWCVVFGVAIPMRRLVFWCRPRPVESNTYEDGNLKSSIVDAYLKSSIKLMNFKDAAFHRQIIAVFTQCGAWQRFDPAEAGRLITWVPLDWAPLFCHDVISHFATLVRRGQALVAEASLSPVPHLTRHDGPFQDRRLSSPT